MTFFGGYRPDPPDERDFIFDEDCALMGARLLAEPETIDWSFHLDAVQNQLANSCVGHSVASAAYLTASVNGPKIDRPSPLFPYTIARLLEGSPIRDVGCYPRDAMRGLAQYGLIANNRWPERSDVINATPPLDAFKAGDEARLGGYYRILRGDDGKSIIEALRRGFCPLFGMQVDDSYMTYRGGLWAPGGANLGGHAQVICGYHGASDAFRVLNSWSAGWGDGGFAWIPRTTLCARYQDLWVLSILPESIR